MESWPGTSGTVTVWLTDLAAYTVPADWVSQLLLTDSRAVWLSDWSICVESLTGVLIQELEDWLNNNGLYSLTGPLIQGMADWLINQHWFCWLTYWSNDLLPTMQETLLINWLIGVNHAYYKFEQPWWEWLSDCLTVWPKKWWAYLLSVLLTTWLTVWLIDLKATVEYWLFDLRSV